MAVVTEDDFGICPVWIIACLAHVTQPAALGAVRPFLRDVCDAVAVIAGIDLDLGWLFT